MTYYCFIVLIIYVDIYLFEIVDHLENQYNSNLRILIIA